MQNRSPQSPQLGGFSNVQEQAASSSHGSSHIVFSVHTEPKFRGPHSPLTMEQLKVNYAFALAAQGKEIPTAKHVLEEAKEAFEGLKTETGFLLKKSDLLGIIYNTLGYFYFMSDGLRDEAYQSFIRSANYCE